jgi:hypothetical protein
MNKILLFCDYSLGLNEHDLYGTGISISLDRKFPYLQKFKNSIMVDFGIRRSEIFIQEQELIVEKIYERFYIEQPWSSIPYFFCNDENDFVKIQEKGYKEVKLGLPEKTKKMNLIECCYDNKMKFYKGKIKFFSLCNEYNIRLGGRKLFL